jgi:peptidoglycan hydrolase CwlO-like protein
MWGIYVEVTEKNERLEEKIAELNAKLSRTTHDLDHTKEKKETFEKEMEDLPEKFEKGEGA